MGRYGREGEYTPVVGSAQEQLDQERKAALLAKMQQEQLQQNQQQVAMPSQIDLRNNQIDLMNHQKDIINLDRDRMTASDPYSGMSIQDKHIQQDLDIANKNALEQQKIAKGASEQRGQSMVEKFFMANPSAFYQKYGMTPPATPAITAPGTSISRPDSQSPMTPDNRVRTVAENGNIATQTAGYTPSVVTSGQPPGTLAQPTGPDEMSKYLAANFGDGTLGYNAQEQGFPRPPMPQQRAVKGPDGRYTFEDVPNSTSAPVTNKVGESAISQLAREAGIKSQVATPAITPYQAAIPTPTPTPSSGSPTASGEPTISTRNDAPFFTDNMLNDSSLSKALKERRRRLAMPYETPQSSSSFGVQTPYRQTQLGDTTRSYFN